jgi:DNA-directed RNA polymerase specialized sigma24 family protein
VTLTEGTLRYEPTSEGLLALDAALLELHARDADMARVVELRYFGGLTLEETAEVLHTSARSVNRLWAAARAWLHRALAGTPSSSGAGG